VCWPPAPVDCIALQRPGAATAARPTMTVLKKVVRYHVRLNGAWSRAAITQVQGHKRILVG
jgi:hypothetical protein